MRFVNAIEIQQHANTNGKPCYQILEYKKIVDYNKGIGINYLHYFCLDREKKREKNLPCSFFERGYQ